jgi:hypothetical protein
MGSVKLHLNLYFGNFTPVCTDHLVVIDHINTPTLWVFLVEAEDTVLIFTVLDA